MPLNIPHLNEQSHERKTGASESWAVIHCVTETLHICAQMVAQIPHGVVRFQEKYGMASDVYGEQGMEQVKARQLWLAFRSTRTWAQPKVPSLFYRF